MVSGSELCILALSEADAGRELGRFKRAIEWQRPELEHQLQASCSLFNWEISADYLKHSAQELWTCKERWRDFGPFVREPLLRAIELWQAWGASKKALEQRLAILAEQRPFPGRCGACPA